MIQNKNIEIDPSEQQVLIMLCMLINKYISSVEMVFNLILNKLALKSKDEFIHHRATQSSGVFYLNGYNKYYFHGRGCKFINDEIEIDWDFGYDDVICGLDPWKLYYYLTDNGISNDFIDGYHIKEMFDDLVSAGGMVKVQGLYYCSPKSLNQQEGVLTWAYLDLGKRKVSAYFLPRHRCQI